ncbi:TPA: hypothetical protein ACTW52_000034 [Klebsiella quasipneumoniae subsp. similipneumoniae]|uniref:hypothetical protein n=1 Tax=Klebsiella quasipneumoniae TaxID=1463165 RepID=UPI002181AADD|nr:hypothetical protein [Klebsiella quasipneumoniae]MEB5580674.1 hypothetical protein [Klebsiella quasipneumoniae]MEB5745390.1 hypothetical protein [Klebsiella quasipneumoniae]GKQ11081.1 hypothetical protein NUKP79_48020 [Klebsiella quasipneumoniae]HCI8788184.1 hypothetical protein [Klebsiella quasipneumoniae]
MDKLTSKDLKTLMNFIEEFSWVANKYKNIDAKKLIDYINNVENSKKEESFYSKYRYDSKLRNNSVKEKSFLIGALPALLMDRELFIKNKDLSDFAALIGIEVKFPEKRSRDEIIGTIICSIQDENTLAKVSDIGEFIYRLTSDERVISNIKIEKKLMNDNYDWNRLIRHLYGRG